MPWRATLPLLATLAGTGCALAARDHACWPFLAHQYGGHVPAELSKRLAHESGTRRQVGTYRAPVGYYWRRRQAPSLDVRQVRTLMGDYELAACPNAVLPRAPVTSPPLPPPR